MWAGAWNPVLELQRRISLGETSKFTVRRRGAIVNQSTSVQSRVVRSYVDGTALQIERRSHAVGGAEAKEVGAVLVGVEIDESGCDDVAGSIDDLAPGQRRLADRPDRPVGDADVADGVEARFRVHNPSVRDHEVIRLRRYLRCDETYDEAAQDDALERQQEMEGAVDHGVLPA